MNWLSKLDSFITAARAEAVAYWEVATILAICCSLIAAIIAIKSPSRRQDMRSKMRIFLYCKNCKYADLNTETCAVGADFNEKCAAIDKTASENFTITKDD